MLVLKQFGLKLWTMIFKPDDCFVLVGDPEGMQRNYPPEIWPPGLWHYFKENGR